MKEKFKIRNPNDRNPKQSVSNIRISNLGFSTFVFLSLILSILLIAGCSGLKSSWVNFRAHYNSYYNAEKSFRAGLQKVEQQPVQVNPESPVRVHPPPPAVGPEDFDNTIEKGARILRKFPESKWTDETLFMIGKSYYYKRNFFLAVEKFEELYNLAETVTLRRQAAIWKARSLLDLEQYNEGISYINSVLEEDFWTTAGRAEMRVLLAEHHAQQQNWDEAAGELGEAIAGFKEGVIKGRVFFLYGQVLERLERFGEAFFAYDNVASRFPEYDYVYWSRMKKAEVARKEGNLDTALSIYTAMSRDDKNFERLDRINYEIARTREMGGQYAQAEREYNSILRSDRTPVSSNVAAKTYFRLGKIYSDIYKNLSTAAAYFDSSSTRVADADFLESSFNADELASAYGSYSNLRSRVTRLDSLLWLGSLEPAQLDSVLNEIRRQRQQVLNRPEAKEESEAGRLVNVSDTGQSPDAEAQPSFEYGFLNYKDPRLKRESMAEFAAVWGSRPLVDNWRHMEAVRGISVVLAETLEAGDSDASVPLDGAGDSELEIDVSEIPRSEDQREAYRRQLVNARYELGNLFFITLNMPDSAATYFTDIVRNHPDSPLAPQSMYSLFEINSETGDEQRADYWTKRILREFPKSRYADIIRNRIQEGEQVPAEDTESRNLAGSLQSIEQEENLSETRAERFRNLAIANRSDDIAPFIHYRAIQTYVELAKQHTDPVLYQNFMEARESKGQSLSADSTEWRSYPFYGSYWDSVRTVITEYDTLFDRQPHDKELDVLRQALDKSKLPEEPPEGAVVNTGDGRAPEQLKACEEMPGIDIVGGMSNFLARIDFPDEPGNTEEEMPEAIAYELLISKQGKVSYYKRISRFIDAGFREKLENGISRYLLFDPPTVDGEPREVRCKMTFPLGK